MFYVQAFEAKSGMLATIRPILSQAILSQTPAVNLLGNEAKITPAATPNRPIQRSLWSEQTRSPHGNCQRLLSCQDRATSFQT